MATNKETVMKIKPFSTLWQQNKDKFEGKEGEEVAEQMYDLIVPTVRQEYSKGDISKIADEIKKRVTTSHYAKNQKQYSFFEGLVHAYNMIAPKHDRLDEIPQPDIWLDELNAKIADMEGVKKVDE